MIEFRFAYPFVLLLIFPAGWMLYRRFRRQQTTTPTLEFSAFTLAEDLPISWRVRLRWLPDLLRLLAWLLLLIALARPQTGSAREILRGEGVDIVLAVDISSSMTLPDYAPDRLSATKAVMKNFIDQREFDRIGIVVFASDAYYQAPPTLDYDLLRTLVDDIRPAAALGLEQKTALGLGIASAANMLRNSDSASRIIIILTDGANNAGAIDPITAAEAASRFGIRIYTVGIGQPGLIAVTDERGQIDLIESELDETMLEKVAELAGGSYYLAINAEELQQIYQEIDRLERSGVERQLFVRWQDQVMPWILAGLLLFLGGGIMKQTVFQTLP